LVLEDAKKKKPKIQKYYGGESGGEGMKSII
jgi:hypothetical protein